MNHLELSNQQLDELWRSVPSINLVKVYYALNKAGIVKLPADETWKQLTKNFYSWDQVWSTIFENDQKARVLAIYSENESIYASDYLYLEKNSLILGQVFSQDRLVEQEISLTEIPEPPEIDSSLLNPDFKNGGLFTLNINSTIYRITESILDDTPITCWYPGYFQDLEIYSLHSLFHFDAINQSILQGLKYFLYKLAPIHWDPQWHFWFPEFIQKQIQTILLINLIQPRLPLEMWFAIFEYLSDQK